MRALFTIVRRAMENPEPLPGGEPGAFPVTVLYFLQKIREKPFFHESFLFLPCLYGISLENPGNRVYFNGSTFQNH